MNKDLRTLFELVDSKGEGVYKKVHIISTVADHGDHQYRVYHAEGLCFDIAKVYHDPEEMEHTADVDETGNAYSFYAGYEGFQDIDVSNCLRIMKRSFK